MLQFLLCKTETNLSVSSEKHLTCEVILSVTASRPPDNIPWVSARVKVTLPSPPTPDEDITKFCAETADWDMGVAGGRFVPPAVLSSG